MNKSFTLVILFIFPAFFCIAQQTTTVTRAASSSSPSNQPDNYTTPPSSTRTYQASVWSTNFTVPILRFNVLKKSANNEAKGNVALFNSIGAGFGISWGRLEETTDNTGKVINTEMHNSFGIQVGVLFATNSSGGNNANIFAPTLSVSVLNFNVGFGHELGTLPDDTHRGFLTVAYGIPISKLVKGGFYIRKRGPAVANNRQGFR
ncbi:MAG: hypothetical protein JNK79_11010 [Chitinophagaceae bacterium]|nr:hypothetical protein [Chitinophagaceae bacterium]